MSFKWLAYLVKLDLDHILCLLCVCTVVSYTHNMLCPVWFAVSKLRA